MIRRISDRNDIDCKALSKTHLGKKMLSYLEAYGTDYDFCRFYVNESGSVLLIINSTAITVCTEHGSGLPEIKILM